MNSLSWMIYAADVVESVKVVSCIAGAFGLIAWICGQTVGRMVVETSRNEDAAEKSRRSFCRVSVKIALVAAPFIVVVPSASTIYAIAASEMGEQVLNSPTGGKAMKALDAWLDRQIAGEASGK